ncbi:caspase-7 [Octopus bimaculoides]|uniref:Caspase family p20 domain-containing protein n=1 Tax=Octopus bimaculoides TaxID=37653 RepID=A0A0L8H440_OCTBM|nr:caspase-7 [Octopus bimaculoides]|eukprot:XP_014775610.1 PREDICTED: caspase-1-like [Octopus bimaculoides]
MTHKKRGIAYIFNIENFSDSELKICHGISKDAQDFKSALRSLGFCEEDIHVHTDSRTEEMKEILQSFGEENLDVGIDCFICAILSCGNSDGLIYGYDDAIELEKLLSYLKPDRCPCLKGIPKLFFVQACRGSKIDSGIEKNDADSNGFEKTSPKIPVMADILVAYSSCNEYPSFGSKERGSWFMQALSDILMKYGNKHEIMTLLTAVSNYVASFDFQSSDNSVYNGCKQMPHITSTLTKQLKFLNRDP